MGQFGSSLLITGKQIPCTIHYYICKYFKGISKGYTFYKQSEFHLAP